MIRLTRPLQIASAGSVSLMLLAFAFCHQAAMAETGFWDDNFTHAKSGIWDDNFTRAKSGVEGDLLDPGNSDGKSGLKVPTQTFFIPPPRDFENVDPEEIADNKKKDYSPYALALFPQNFVYRGVTISKGYYQVKLGDRNDGSPKANLNELAKKPPSRQTVNFAPNGLPEDAVPQTSEASDDFDDVKRTLVLKKLGNVVLVLPVDRREVRKRAKGEKKIKRPISKVEFENHMPVLKYFIKNTVYSTYLDN